MLARTVNTMAGWREEIAGRSAAHNSVLALVWLTFATSGIVFSEPAPTDAFALLLIVLLPVVGLVRASPILATLLMAWTTLVATGLFAATFAIDAEKALKHILITFYLAGSAFTFAGFVACDPARNAKRIFDALMIAACLAATAAIAGYFDVFSTGDTFTKFGRATGTFKDPNVYGPFLVPSVIYALHKVLERPLIRAASPLLLAAGLSLGVLLSFSRGAWINLVVSLLTFLALSFVTARSNARRQKIMLLAGGGAALLAAVVALALQADSVSGLFAERASLAQSYDVGPEGRFGGQEKATRLILDNPLGIGSGQFATFHHHEEAHNVYLSMTLGTGWLGCGIFVLIILATILVGLGQAFTPSAAQPLVLVALSTFAATAAEGMIVDIDHWRHIYFMMAIIWGTAAAARSAVGCAAPPARYVAHRPARIVV